MLAARPIKVHETIGEEVVLGGYCAKRGSGKGLLEKGVRASSPFPSSSSCILLKRAKQVGGA